MAVAAIVTPTMTMTNVPFKLRPAVTAENQRTNGPVNAHLISLPSKAQNKQNLENI